MKSIIVIYPNPKRYIQIVIRRERKDIALGSYIIIDGKKIFITSSKLFYYKRGARYLPAIIVNPYFVPDMVHTVPYKYNPSSNRMEPE